MAAAMANSLSRQAEMISTTTYTCVVPAAPYQITVPNFVSDLNRVYVNGRELNPADPSYAPGAGQYTFNNDGLYSFNVAQVGLPLSIKYRELTGGGSGALAGILAATVNESFAASFNDYGAPGSVDVWGTWDVPCWNAAFPVPGRIDAGAYRARDPYTWWWDGASPIYISRPRRSASPAPSTTVCRKFRNRTAPSSMGP